MPVEDVVRVEEHSFLNYLKKAKVNSDKVLDVFVREKEKQQRITEQELMKLNGGRDKPHMGSIC